MTPFGFFSIVAFAPPNRRPKPEDKHFVLVRARDRRDALDFKSFIEQANGDIDVQPPSLVTDTPDADYRYRFVASRRAIGHALSVFVTEELEYDNFKSEVYRTQGPTRANLYGHVWKLLRDGLQPPTPRDEAPPRSGETSGRGRPRA